MKNKVILIILDGWGIGDKSKSDAIYQANTPYIDSLIEQYPNSQLLTSGKNVGLPDGQMGNSEVGHLTIGAGRIVFQDFVRINNAVKNNSITKNQTLINAFNYAKKNNKPVHFLGLVSDGGVHSSDKHLYKLCDIAKEHNINKVYIHAITDGRDTDPKSGLGFVKNLQEHLKNSTGEIASLAGRYYTMDRDKRWERIKQGYDLLVYGKGKATENILQAIQQSYNEGITDEFIKPIVKIDENNKPVGLIQPDDVVICFNFRTDRLREITIALTQKNFQEYQMQAMNLYYLTMTRYDDTFKNVKIIYDKKNVTNTLGEIMEKAGKKQIRIAETEKYAHVTFFFSGGREKEFKNEKRILIPSPKVSTYDLKPEMSAYEVEDAIIPELKKQDADFICLNFANGDMVGHTGVYTAIIKAVEVVDRCVKNVVETALSNNYTVIIISDHGNADNTINQDGSPNTAHSLNPVPCILISDKYKLVCRNRLVRHNQSEGGSKGGKIENGILPDIAPTILTIMGIKVPDEMTGKVLV